MPPPDLSCHPKSDKFSEREREILIARQPIYDRALDCTAYELLYRCGDTPGMGSADGNQATAQVILNAFVEMGLQQILDGRRAFVNFTRDLLLMDVSQVLPPQMAAIEVLENIVPDPELLRVLELRSEQGYTIVLDDFRYSEALLPLVRLADMIKLDIRSMTHDELWEHRRLLEPYDVKLLAEKVETLDEFHLCKDMGFEYFQGYFLARPVVIRGQRMPPNRLATLRLLTRLQDPNVHVRELESLVRQDVTLSFSLLRSVNSATFPRRTRVESIGQAILILGLDYVRNWASLAVLSRLGEKPRELMTTANVRARMCEGLGTALNAGCADAFFTIGLFSVVDALMDRPMEEIVGLLPLDARVAEALTGGSGIMGQVLHTVVAYEKGDWGNTFGLPLTENMLRRAYLDAVRAAVDFDHQFATQLPSTGKRRL